MFRKAVVKMIDRLPQYPGRVRLIPVDGEGNKYDMILADEPVQLETPLNKSTLLQDSTVALYKETVSGGEENWKESSMPSSAAWYAATYGGNKFVCVADNSNKVAYSVDGIHWTERILPAIANWRSVAYGGGKFVALAHNSNIAAYSADGIAWAASTLPETAKWSAITYGDGKFVAVSGGMTVSNKAAYSTDGINWVAITLPESMPWRSIAYGGGKFVIVGFSTDIALYSTNGISWNTTPLPYYLSWKSVIYGNKKFVANIDSYNETAYSYDGITWKTTSIAQSQQWNTLVYGNNKFFASAYDTERCAYSQDGILWTNSTLPYWHHWRAGAYGDNKFILIAYNSDKLLYNIQHPETLETVDDILRISLEKINDSEFEMQSMNEEIDKMETQIEELQAGVADATATENDILMGKTAYIKTGKVTGTIPIKSAATYTPLTRQQVIRKGQYLEGSQTIAGDENFKPENIKSGVTIFGVEGNASSFAGFETTTIQVQNYTSYTVHILYTKFIDPIKNPSTGGFFFNQIATVKPYNQQTNQFDFYVVHSYPKVNFKDPDSIDGYFPNYYFKVPPVYVFLTDILSWENQRITIDYTPSDTVAFVNNYEYGWIEIQPRNSGIVRLRTVHQ